MVPMAMLSASSFLKAVLASVLCPSLNFTLVSTASLLDHLLDPTHDIEAHRRRMPVPARLSQKQITKRLCSGMLVQQ